MQFGLGRHLCRVALVMSVWVQASLLAHANAIDGEWCREGRSFRIDGTNISTYGGSNLAGETDGYRFRYVAPASESEAGTEIFMVLRSEATLYLLRKPQGASGFSDREAWQRCKVTS